MSDHYVKELLRVAVAQICQTIGYNATQTAPLELLQDVLDKFMREFTRDLRRQVEHYNRTEANLNDVTLTLSSINVNLNELLDYINNVEPVPFITEVPKFPARKDSALNFLKPGSKEVLTRPVHVHDHLPPMLPPDIAQVSEIPLTINANSLNDAKSLTDNTTNSTNNANIEFNNDAINKSFNATSILDQTTLQSLFKPSNNYDDGERPTREVSSVVMTTGGYISPAVEGKMPEGIVPDIIDKLLGLDAPPPPPPPPPPPQSKTDSRPGNSALVSNASEALTSVMEKDLKEREVAPSTSKDSKKLLARNLEPQPILNKKMELYHEFQAKKNKLFNPSSGKGYSNEPLLPQAMNKKSFMMHQNAANMLLKKAKKQKAPIMQIQPGVNEKHNKPLTDKICKMDAADKAHKKYMKMIQKMTKQGKIPPELLSNVMGSDKKSKIINPDIVASMPPGPEKLQLEKLMRKQAKQRQKMLKQQLMAETKKQSKKPLQQLPALVPIFPPRTTDAISKPLALDMEDQKFKSENIDVVNISPPKQAVFTPIVLSATSSAQSNLQDTFLPKSNKASAINENTMVDINATSKSLSTPDGKELKLSNEPDRSKLNIFKKISKQKTPKSSSPTPMRVPGLCDPPIINLPSGTTITPTPALSNTTNSSLTPGITPLVGKNVFPPLSENNNGGITSNIITAEGIKDKPIVPPLNPNQPTDLSMLNRVFGEKPTEMDLVNKPKKRGRKPGSKNAPKVPGVLPNSAFKKNNKKIKLDNANNIFPPQMTPHLPSEFAASGVGNLSFDNVAQFFGNALNPMEWAKNTHLQQQMIIMANAKERKEQKKKNKMPKQEFSNNEKNTTNISSMPNPNISGPTNEEVQTINKKLKRMDTVLKPAPLTGPPDLTIDTSLITGKKLPSPSMFPPSSTPLKSPGNTKRMMNAAVDSMAGGLVQPFMLPNRPAFPNLPNNMLSMLQFPFPTRPSLIPSPGLFPTPGLGAFPNNPKNPLLPGLFPFHNIKHPLADNSPINPESEDLTTDKKKLEPTLQTAERSYCNVAPLVPDFLTKLSEQNLSTCSMNKQNTNDTLSSNEPDLPKTPKPRSSHSSTFSQDNLLRKIADVHTPESTAGSLSSKSIPTTPGGLSVNTFEHLMKKCDSPVDLMSFNKHTKSLSSSQESGLDFSINKKSTFNSNIVGMAGGLSIKTPITLNNEPIEVSDDSDETNHPQPPKTEKRQTHVPTGLSHLSNLQPQQSTHHTTFNMDDMFVANNGAQLLPKAVESDLSTKELKKLKKQVKKTSSCITSASLMNTDKVESRAVPPMPVPGVGKLAGGADLIPLVTTGLAYSSKNIPYNSLTANSNPSYHHHKTDFPNTTTAIPAVAASSSTSVFDNVTITASVPIPAAVTSNTPFDLQKKRKEHKKLKKLKELKEGKIKKKKDKKDKNKNKEKSEKYLLGQAQNMAPKDKEKEHLHGVEPVANMQQGLLGHSIIGASEKVKEKDLLKKLKKEKKKEKQRSTFDDLTAQNPSVTNQISILSTSLHKENNITATSANMSTLEIEQPKKQKLSPGLGYAGATIGERNETSLTVNTTSTTSASIIPKLTLKLGSTHSPTPPREDNLKSCSTSASAAVANVTAVQPPPHSLTPPCEREPSPELARISPLVTRPPKHKLNASGDIVTSSTTNINITAANASSLEIGEGGKAGSISNPNMIIPPPSPWLSGGTISASSVLLPHQLLQTTKQHDITTTSINAAHTDTAIKNTSTDRQSPLTLITETSRPSSYIDAEGNRVWICPACGKVDDGSPMIGCDGCDAWYHWVCVGIFVAPKDNEDWFCRVCITRKKGLHGSDKKRKRNKKK